MYAAHKKILKIVPDQYALCPHRAFPLYFSGI